ncbi:MAG: chemotaxis protein CheB [Candidatus Stygibacter frigidus]|nr:chemotaxis protein CheB [Candidatus Stygibacter frigidus]
MMTKGSEDTKRTRQISKVTTIGQFHIVGIGASAGGLEAMEHFFGNMPPGNGLAFVVIQHLDPHHVGIMPELLQRITEMKVMQAIDGAKVHPNSVYVIPPNKSMSILNGSLQLFDPVESHGLRLPIDIFFRSLADDRGENSIGIILSGMGSDGSLGLKAIKEKDGIVVVQSPETAKFDGMPRSALGAVIADIEASAEDLPEKLINFLNHIPVLKKESIITQANKSNLEKIFILLRDHTGNDFSDYKVNTLLRRIGRRQNVHQIKEMSNYVRYLQENPGEVEILFKELLIGVTSFFRDTKVWELISEKVMPELIERAHDGQVLRAWVPGCSTGEEAYSLAMVFIEILEQQKPQRNISLQIFATDIDTDAIEKARKGNFPNNIAGVMSSSRISRFFIATDDGYRLKTTIREMVVFATQNVIKDPPFTKLDIISCRNLLIYLEPVLQKRIISLFNYSLNNSGILLLGTSETIGYSNTRFIEIDSRCKIFQNPTATIDKELIDLPGAFYKSQKQDNKQERTAKKYGNIQELTEKYVLERYAPASVLVNGEGDIIHISGRTGKYLEPASGKANWNIHAMAREGLSEILSRSFRQARQSYKAVKVPNVKIGINGGTQIVDVIVQRIDKPEPLKDAILIVFEDVTENIAPTGKAVLSKAKGSGPERELSQELQRVNEEMNFLRGEMQSSEEELRSTNEELQSTNEELQSTNEELTTSREEMQSMNEELQTVNQELQSKVNDYVQANDDMKNLLNSTEIGTLFLDKKLNIRRFTNNLTKIFKLRGSDIGRPFTDLVTDLNNPDLEFQAREVLRTLIYNEEACSTSDGRWFNIRIMPYRTLNDLIDGLVITFNDVTIAKELELQLKEANEILEKKKNELNSRREMK